MNISRNTTIVLNFNYKRTDPLIQDKAGLFFYTLISGMYSFLFPVTMPKLLWSLFYFRINKDPFSDRAGIEISQSSVRDI